MDHVVKLTINGRFLSPGVQASGVQRVARELLFALDDLLASDATLRGALSCRVLVPDVSTPTKLALKAIHVESTGPWARAAGGNLWEQLMLPVRARNDMLVNLCNVGPWLHRNALTMMHDAQVWSSPASYSRAFRAWYRLLQPSLGRRHQAILTVSRFSREQLYSHGVAEASRIHVIPNGCDHVLRVQPDPALLQALGLAGRKYVVALSSTQAHKNIGVLLEAFESPALRDVLLVLFGSADRGAFESGGRSLPANVRFAGRVNDEQLVGLLQAAAVFAFPSTTEGFGLPPMEAMALGCPVIVAPCGALPEVCGEAALRASPDAPSQWVQQILRLCEDSEYARMLRQRGLQQAYRFTWKNSAKILLQVIFKHGRSMGQQLQSDQPNATLIES